MALKALVIHPDDNVANLIGPGTKGASVECTVEGTSDQCTIKLREDLPSNHKFAFTDIKAGDTITKYGLNIGRASRAIARGAHVHAHNIESNRGRGDLKSSG